MNIGGLTIEMAADLARLRRDMDEAKSSVGGAMLGINKTIDTVMAGAKAFAGYTGVKMFVGMISGAIDAQAGLHDLSKATGMSVAALGEFRKVGAYTETTTEAIAGAALKLSKNLALTDEDGKGAALAIKALGLNFDDFRKLNPEQRMLAAAQALNKYEDGADKSAAAMLLFGKEGAKLLPFLGDLAESSEEINKTLTAQEKATRAAAAAMADNYGDNLTKIQKQGEAWKKDLAMGLLPALYEVSEAIVQVSGGTGGLGQSISDLARSDTFANWIRSGVTGLSYLLDVGQGLLSLFPLVGKTIAGIAATSVQTFTTLGDVVGKVMRGDFSGAVEEMKSGFAGVMAIGESTANDISAIWNQKLIGQSFRESMQSLKGVQVEGEKTKDALNLTGTLADNEAAKARDTAASKAATEEQKKHAAAVESAKKAGIDFVASLDLKNAGLQQELDLGRKLTPVEQENLKLTKDLSTGKVVLSEADEKAARAAIEYGAALEREIAWQQESHKANQAQVEAIDKTIESLQAETEKQRQANAEMGLSTEQLSELRRAKLEDLAVQAERKAALMDEIDWTGQLGDQQRELAKAYRESAAVAQEGAAAKAAKEAQDAWQKTIDSVGQGLTDSLFRAFEAGKGFWTTLWDGIKNTVKTTALKVVIQGTDGKGGIMGSVMGLFGGGSGSGGGGSMLGTIGGWLGSAGSWLGSGSTAGGMGSTVGGWMSSAGSWLGGTGGAGVSGLASSLKAFGPWAALIGMGMGQADKAFGEGYSHKNLPAVAQVLFPQHKLDTSIAAKLVGDRWANIISGASLTTKIFNWGRGQPHQGAAYVSDGVNGYDVNNGGSGLGWAYGDSVGKYWNQDIQTALKSVTGSAASMLNELSKAFGGNGGFQVGGYFASDNERASQGGRSVLLNGRVISEWGGSGLDKDAATGLQQLTDALAGQVRDAMGQIDLPAWAREQLAALGSGATMEQLAVAALAIHETKAALQDFSDAVTPLGGVFGRIAGLSADAQMQLVGFAGGMDAFLAKAQSFVQNYYSTDEQNAIAAAQIQKALTDAGIDASLSSKDDFKALVQSADVQTEEGRKQLAALLDLNAAFAPLGDYLAEQGQTLAELAAQAPQVAALQAATDSTAAALDLQQQSADRLVQLDNTFQGVGASLGGLLQAMTQSLEAGLAAVAANTAEMNRRFDRWDGDDGMQVVST